MNSILKRYNRRKDRVRYKISRSTTRQFRLTIFKSNRHITVQVINSDNNTTVISASTLEKELRQLNKSNCNKIAAEKIGNLIAERAFAQGIKQVVFDRGGNKYHGIIKSFADAARTKLDF